MNKCQNCKNNCCGNKFIGLKSAFKHTNSDIFCQILLSQEEVNKIVEFGGEKYIESKGNKSYISLNEDNSCKAFKNGKCDIYDVRPYVCQLYPFYFDPFCGIVIDKNCEKYQLLDFNEYTYKTKQKILNLLKKRIKFFEELYKNDEKN